MSSEPLSREWFRKLSKAVPSDSDEDIGIALREAVAEALEFMAVRFEADCKADAAETLRAKAREVREG